MSVLSAGDGDDAFISYSHAVDDDIARALERGLERLARPWNRLRAVSVFRDETDLQLSPDLWGSISRRLDRSRFLILLVSPQAAASRWVDREVARWCDAWGTERLLLVWTGGELGWDDEDGDFSAGSTAVPESLRGRFAAEPLYLDLRWARGEADLSLGLSRFRSAVAQVAAPIRGMPPDELEGEDIRLHRRARRVRRAAVAMLCVLGVTATVAAFLAVANANEADRRTRDALARQVGLAALDLPASQIDEAFLQSLASGQLAAADDPSRFQATGALIGRYSRLTRLLPIGAENGFVNVRGLAIDDDGSSVVAAAGSASGAVSLVSWTRLDGGSAAVSGVPGGTGDRLRFAGDGSTVVAGRPGTAAVRRTSSGDVVPFEGTMVDIDPAGELAWFAVGDELQLRRLTDGGEVATVAASGSAPVAVDVGRRRGAVLADGSLSVVDSATGAMRFGASAASSGSVIAVGETDDTVVVEVTEDGAIVRWSIEGDRLFAAETVPAPDGIGTATWLAVAADGERVVLVGSAGTAIVELGTGLAVAVPGGGATVVEVDPSGRYVALGGSRLAVWDLTTGHRSIAVPQAAVALDWSGPCDAVRRCRLVAAGTAIDVIDPIGETQVRLVEEINAQAVAISGDGTTVVSGGWGDTVAVWSVTPTVDDSTREEITEKELIELPSVTGAASSRDDRCRAPLEATSPDGVFVVAFDAATAITSVCRVGAGGGPIALAKIDTAFGPVTAAAIGDDGHVALARASGRIEYFEVSAAGFARGVAVDARVGGEVIEVDALAMRGGVIVAGLRFPVARATPARVVIWRIDAFEVTSFPTDFVDVAAVAVLDEDATAVVVAGRDADDGPVTIQLWSADLRRRVGRALTGLVGEVDVLVGSNGDVVGADAAGHRFRWHLDQDPSREVCEIVGRSLSRAEWDDLAAGALRHYTFDPPCG